MAAQDLEITYDCMLANRIGTPHRQIYRHWPICVRARARMYARVSMQKYIDNEAETIFMDFSRRSIVLLLYDIYVYEDRIVPQKMHTLILWN